MQYSMSQADHQRIFGPKDPMDDTGTGRTRRCKVTGQWFKLGQNPHNAPTERPKRNPDLAAPLLAPSFEPFQAGAHDAPVNIMNRHDKREYMERNDLAEYDEGVGHKNEWVEKHEYRRELVEDIKRFEETDPLALSPDLKAQRHGEGDVKESGDIQTDGIAEVNDDEALTNWSK